MFFGIFLRIMISSVLRFSMWFNINLVISKILLSSTLSDIVKSTSWDNEFTILLQRSLISDEFNFLTSHKEGSEQDLKTRYEITINNLEEVFHPADIYYGFYEELFSDISHHKIEHFLGIQLQPFNAAHIANASPKQLHLPKQLNLEIVERYRQTYNFIRNRYGNSMLNLWQGYQLL